MQAQITKITLRPPSSSVRQMQGSPSKTFKRTPERSSTTKHSAFPTPETLGAGNEQTGLRRDSVISNTPEDALMESESPPKTSILGAETRFVVTGAHRDTRPLDRFAQDAEVANKTIDGLQAYILSLQSQFKDCVADKEHLGQMIECHEADIKKLSEKNQQLKNEVSVAKREIREAESTMKNTTLEHTELRSEHEIYKKRIVALQKQTKELKRQDELAKQDLASIQTACEKYKVATTALEEERLDLQRERDDLRTTIESLELERSALKANEILMTQQMLCLENDYEADIARHESDLHKSAASSQLLHDTIQTLQSQKLELEVAVQAANKLADTKGFSDILELQYEEKANLKAELSSQQTSNKEAVSRHQRVVTRFRMFRTCASKALLELITTKDKLAMLQNSSFVDHAEVPGQYLKQEDIDFLLTYDDVETTCKESLDPQHYKAVAIGKKRGASVMEQSDDLDVKCLRSRRVRLSLDD